MKRRIYIFLFLLGSVAACKDVLDKEPLNIIPESTVWSDQALINAYVSQVYSELTYLFNDATNDRSRYEGPGNPEDSFDFNLPSELSDESRCTYPWLYTWYLLKPGFIDKRGGLLEWWGYSTIRKMNEFIERMETVTVLDAPVKKSLLAEMRVLRAMTYFQMVKRYGGVPLITKVQAIDAPKEELFVSRNKEIEIYDFVNAEIDAVLADLPVGSSSSGHVTKGTALALKSRSSLYAGSIAKYGTVQLNGLVGIPASEATRFYQASYDASNAIITSGQYSLYKKEADKVKNYQNIFLDENNVEVIFSKQYNGQAAVGHSWDLMQEPNGFNAWGVGNNSAVYLEMVDDYENMDGSPTKLDPTILQDKVWSMDELFGKKDPRFHASIYYEGTPWQGQIFRLYKGLKKPDGTILSAGDYNGITANGANSASSSTGFGVKKYLDESLVQPGGGMSRTDWIVFRYGEILLNRAEAAFELNKPEEALTAVNQIRERAGILPLLTIDRDKIRHERKVELAFEGHRYWDLRRWRLATTALTKTFTGIEPILDFTTKKYQIKFLKAVDGDNQPRFDAKFYYFPIGVARIANNPKLVENPGWE